MKVRQLTYETTRDKYQHPLKWEVEGILYYNYHVEKLHINETNTEFVIFQDIRKTLLKSMCFFIFYRLCLPYHNI